MASSRMIEHRPFYTPSMSSSTALYIPPAPRRPVSMISPVPPQAGNACCLMPCWSDLVHYQFTKWSLALLNYVGRMALGAGLCWANRSQLPFKQLRWEAGSRLRAVSQGGYHRHHDNGLLALVRPHCHSRLGYSIPQLYTLFPFT